MIVVGLTGSLGMGKTTTANMLRGMGYPVHCSDDAVHALMNAGGAGVDAVAADFPAARDKSGQGIDRRALRALLGKDHAAWDRLERILHPLVVGSQQAFLQAQRAKGVKIAVLDIPLLFETGAQARVDYTICVTAPAFLQRQRAFARPGMTAEDFAFRLSRQMPDGEKRKRADFIVQTGLGLAYTRWELRNIIKKIDRKKRVSS